MRGRVQLDRRRHRDTAVAIVGNGSVTIQLFKLVFAFITCTLNEVYLDMLRAL